MPGLDVRAPFVWRVVVASLALEKPLWEYFETTAEKKVCCNELYTLTVPQSHLSLQV